MIDQNPYLSPHRTPAELAAEHVALRRAVGPGHDRGEHPIIDACLRAPLHGAMREIARWRHVWAPQVAPGFDPLHGPEIALYLDVTTRGNLDVLWVPMMTQEQHDASPDDFKWWLRSLARQEIAQRRDEQIYFLRDYRNLENRVNDQDDYPLTPLRRIEAHCLIALLSDLPHRLSHLVRAHWQDVLTCTWSNGPGEEARRPLTMDVIDAWTLRSDRIKSAMRECLRQCGTDAQGVLEAWAEGEKAPRVRTETGRARVAGRILGVDPETVVAAVNAIRDAEELPDREPDLWWNREDPYPRHRIFS